MAEQWSTVSEWWWLRVKMALLAINESEHGLLDRKWHQFSFNDHLWCSMDNTVFDFDSEMWQV